MIDHRTTRRVAARVWCALVAPLAMAACAADPPAAVVTISATGCGAFPAHGVGTLIGPGRVLTAAHTVAGAEALTVTVAERQLPATIVALDPARDLAVLDVDDRATPRWSPSARRVERDTTGVIYVVRDDTVRAVTVRLVRPVDVVTTDVYGEGEFRRQGFELAGPVEPGDSGAPVLVAGEWVGVVWARSSIDTGRAWAVDPTALAADPAADPARCPAHG